MIEIFGLDVSSQIFFRLMISFAFFIGIILLVAPSAFEELNKSFKKEYGLRTRLMPKVENTVFDIVDKTILKYRVLAGLMITIAAFFLLLTQR